MSLSEQATSGVKWSTASQVGRQATQLFTVVSLSGFGFRPNRRSSAARYLKALGSGANHRLAFSEQEDELRDYELLCETSQTIIHAVMSRLWLRRLARA
jgi:hypothetical protein